MNVQFVLDQIGALEYNFTYQPGFLNGWSMFYRGQEFEGPTLESIINQTARFHHANP